VICDTSIFSKLTKLSTNSSHYSFNQNEEEWDSNFDLIIRNLELSDEIITSTCVFKIFDQITLKEIGKIDLPLKHLLSFQGEIKTQTLFFDLSSMFMPGFKAILHMKIFKRTAEDEQIVNFDTYLRNFSEGNNKIIDPIYGYLIDLEIQEKRHLKLFFMIFNQINLEVLLPPIDEMKNFAQNYSFIKYQYLSFYLNKSCESIARSNRNLMKWTTFLEDLVAFQADLLSEIEEKKGIENLNNPHDEKYGNLLVSDSFIEKEARQILKDERDIPNKFHIFSSIFYLLDEWEKTSNGKWFYQNVQSLCKEGIPYVLREQFWLEFGKIKRILFQTEVLLENIHLNPFQQEQRGKEIDKRKEIYQKLLKEAKNYDINGLSEFFEDLDQYVIQSFYNLTNREISVLKNVFQAMFFWKSLLTDKKYFYSKELISLALKFIRFYRAENNLINEENVFWLLVTFLTTAISHYFEYDPKEQINYLSLSLNGIKADLFILEFLVQEHLPKIYTKIMYFGLSFMHYFSKHFLSLFVDFFNEEMCFRLWDVLLFEGGAGGQVIFSIYFIL